MFQTDFHIFLQSFENEFLTGFMRFITALGYVEFFMAFITAMLFFIDFKKGIILLLILFWTGGTTFYFKHYFHLPRPFHVDSRVQFLDGKLEDEVSFDFTKMGAKNFWDTLPNEVLTEVRKTEEIAFGFPSGHTSVALALWGAMLFLFRQRWVRFLSWSFIFLIPFSRIYLGVHFIADVLGGYALGGIILFCCWWIVLKKEKLQAFLREPKLDFGFNLRALFLLISPFLFYFILPLKLMQVAGSLLGFGLGFCLLAHKGFPEEGGNWRQKIGRTLLAILLYGGLHFGWSELLTTMNWELTKPLSFIRYAIEGFVLIWLVVELSIRFRWFERMRPIA